MNSKSNHRIVKNTGLLYFRLFISVVVSLYTVRIVLNSLGVVDYGIFNVVSGLVTSLSFLSSSLSSASQRFFSFEIGKGNFKKLKVLFSQSVFIYIIIGVFMVLIMYSLGNYFLNNKLIIPNERLESANLIFKISIFSFLIAILQTPYNAIIISRERMDFYALISIFEVLLKLTVAMLLVWVNTDKLILYSKLFLLSNILIFLIYIFYCYRKFPETRLNFKKIGSLNSFKPLLSYSGWNLFGSITQVGYDQGINLILNLFFGPIINAARSISFQVSNSLSQFSLNFYSAIRPQLIKNYATGDHVNMLNLLYTSSKFSLYLLFIFSIPIYFSLGYVLNIWLSTIPDFTVEFIRLTIIFNFIHQLQIPITTVVQATGNIKNYQIITGILMLSLLPLSYLVLSLGYSPIAIYILLNLISVFTFFVRVKILSKLIDFPVIQYYKMVFFNIIIIAIFLFIICSLVRNNLLGYFSSELPILFLNILLTASLIFVFGLNKIERKFLLDYILKIKNKLAL